MTIFTETTVFFELPREAEEHQKFVEQMGDGWTMSDYTTKSIAYSHVTRVWSTSTKAVNNDEP